eukprot:CAMPEP_0114477458 /NCGR_PEP_ID=MMETSP0104-20121206/15373_1 /TAXON_ID=37642 ORGANISM="Paraphysomonas imperforata, Strain PA2" /NCGR_SAMPLE_ID=MMETSP0104 /ASSEMBLY_ACC=CAM_ASM_000202 /LENGTH=71 /DNA_ID=CAMNT_0001652405 /DNA_START=376 /DNA_END=591 /DNA_ORIENTATION=-
MASNCHIGISIITEKLHKTTIMKTYLPKFDKSIFTSAHNILLDSTTLECSLLTQASLFNTIYFPGMSRERY